jgi:hypothetical protein
MLRSPRPSSFSKKQASIPLTAGWLKRFLCNLSGRANDMRGAGALPEPDVGDGWMPLLAHLSFPKIISACSDDAIRTRLVW